MINQGIKISSEEQGIHLKGSLLWFDAPKSHQISFISSAYNYIGGGSKKTQFIQTIGTSKILEALGKKQKSLVCQYNRPFSVGSIKMELLPTGSMVGAASIFLESEGEKLLYAPYAQPQKNTLARKMQLKKTDVLLLDANIKNLKAQLPSRKKEKERLLEMVTSYHKKHGYYPIITAVTLGVAQELTHLFSSNNIPVSVHGQISKINKIYDELGVDLGTYTTYSKRTSKEKLVILPFTFAFSRPFNIPADRDIFAVAHDQDSYESIKPFEGLYQNFIINSKADGSELKEIISAVQPRKVLITGEHVQHYLQELKIFSNKLKPIYKNDQPSLFR